MFDDQDTQNKGAVPPNLPLGEPEDMFANTGIDNDIPDAPQPEPPASQSPTALGAGVLRPKDQPSTSNELQSSGVMQDPQGPADQSPKQNSPQPFERPQYSPQPPSAPGNTTIPYPGDTMNNLQSGAGASMEQNYEGLVKEPIGQRKAVWVIVLVVLIVVLGIGGAWVYFAVIANSNTDTIADQDTIDPFFDTNVATNTVETSTTTDTSDTQDVTPSQTDIEDSILNGDEVPDTDSDGLNDDEEREAGTEALNWDTDGDGLSDGDEVNVWGTNPLNADTDGDGFEDGQEVRNGYNPKGSGKLFQPPTAQNQADSESETNVGAVTTTESDVVEESTSTTAEE